jgi:two-component system chemotaxis response regulator CheY
VKERRPDMGLKVMVVDDSKIVREFMVKTLKLTGIEIENVYLATNGQEGLDVAREIRPDVIFLDINMPVMGGVEMVEKMDTEGLMDATSVVIVSTEGSEVRIEELKRHGVKDYVRKPFTPESIRDVLEKRIGGGHG